MVSKRVREIAFFILRILFSLSIILFIFTKIDINYFIRGIKRINPFFILISFFFYWLTLFLQAYRWKILLNPFLSEDISLLTIFKVYMLGMLINTITPATMGVDISRGLILSEYSSGKIKGFASVLMDRLTGFLGIFFPATLCVLIQYNRFVNKKIVIYFPILFLLLLFGITIIFIDPLKKIMEVVKRKIKILNLGKVIHDFYYALYSYKQNTNLIVYAFILSIILQIFFSFQAFFVGESFGINGNPFLFISFVPIINALNFLPVTISGFGLREAGFFIFFKDYIAKEEAILISIFYGLVSIIGNLPGLYYLFKSPLKRRKKE